MQNLIHIGLLPELLHRFDSHKHPVWEIAYYTAGTGITKIGDKEYSFSPGTIICLPPEQFHSEHSQDGYKNIHFTVHRMVATLENGYVFHDTPNQDYYQILMQLYHEYHMKRDNWENITEALLSVLWQYMISWISRPTKNSLVEEFERFLAQNISTKHFSITEALNRIPMSQDHFRRLFKQQTNRTPLEYLTDLRINHAKRLLANDYLQIKQVAELVGFEDPYYFSRIFTKATGKSPTEWRNENRHGHVNVIPLIDSR